MKKILLILFVFLFLAQITLAGSSSPGTSGFSFLRTNVGARPSAMGGMFVAFSGDLHNIFYNPAGLADISQRAWSISYLKHLLDFHSGFAVFAQPYNDKIGYGISVNYINFGNFTRRDESGQSNGEFGAGSLALSAGAGAQIYYNVLAGATIKYIHSSIDNYTSDAFACDLGIVYHSPIKDFDIGISVSNLGFVRTAFIETKDDLPLQYRVGFANRLAHLPLQFGANVYKYSDDDFRWNVGGEFTLSQNLFLRWGYDSIGTDMEVGSSKDSFAGISLGFGILWRNFHFDYSFSSLGELGTQNRLSIGGTF